MIRYFYHKIEIIYFLIISELKVVSIIVLLLT